MVSKAAVDERHGDGFSRFGCQNGVGNTINLFAVDYDGIEASQSIIITVDRLAPDEPEFRYR